MKQSSLPSRSDIPVSGQEKSDILSTEGRILQVGIIGFGYASATFHVPLITATRGLKLAAVASSAPARVRQALPDVDVVDTPGALCARAEIDLVVIATPNHTHVALARQALEAGKHVVVDKPFALTTEEAMELVALAEERSLQLSVFHNRRWDGDFLTVSRLVADGTLGRITHVESRFDRYRPVVRDRWRESAEPGAGLWYDIGPHLLDQSLQLFGQPDSIWLDLACQRQGALSDDWFHAVLGYGPLRVVLQASLLSARPAPRFTIHGTAGAYVKHGLDTQEAALRAGSVPDASWEGTAQEGLLMLASGQEVLEHPHPGLSGAYWRYYRAMREAILSGSPPPVTARSAYEVVALIQSGIDSAQRRQQIYLQA